MSNYLEILFWLFAGIVFYTYLGYGILVWFMVKIKHLYVPKKIYRPDYSPSVTLLVAAYNEENCIQEKIENSLKLNYPTDKLNIVFVTDGSSDNSTIILAKFPQIKLFHENARKGKMAAINRVMPFIHSDITIFTDANAMLNENAIKEMVKHFENSKIGVVAGEKRIQKAENSTAEVGEGFYWKYESFLKKLDSELNSTVGAAGELYAIRTHLFEIIEADTLLDDFVLSLRICQKGYKIAYEDKAFATEAASMNSEEEMKRKIRICAGGFQSIFRLKTLLNPFKYGILTFQYLSHRVLRWTIVPATLIILPFLNLMLINQNQFYQLTFIAQILFYLLAWMGLKAEKKNIKNRFLTIPYYFTMMNYSVIAGLKRYLTNQQTVIWDKAQRA